MCTSLGINVRVSHHNVKPDIGPLQSMTQVPQRTRDARNRFRGRGDPSAPEASPVRGRLDQHHRQDARERGGAVGPSDRWPHSIPAVTVRGRYSEPASPAPPGPPPITYVRVPDQKDVYSIEQSPRPVTSRSVEAWRDKKIWGLARSDIKRIDLQYPAGSSYTLRRVTSSDTA